MQEHSTDRQARLAEVKEAFGRLYEIILRLRGPDGCPWDRKQSPYTLRTNLVEEAYECVSAIEEEDDENLREELGDLIMVAGMIASIKEEQHGFRFPQVLQEICEKLIRRHPHVFGDAVKETPEEVLVQWDHIKEHVERKKSKHSVLERVPRTLPPLERAFLIQEKVAKVGFDWSEVDPLWDKLAEEIAELRDAREAEKPREMEREFGDLLFTVVNLGRFLGLDPTLALNGTNQKFIARFQELERRLQNLGLAPKEAGLEQMDHLWNQIKEEKT